MLGSRRSGLANAKLTAAEMDLGLYTYKDDDFLICRRWCGEATHLSNAERLRKRSGRLRLDLIRPVVVTAVGVEVTAVGVNER